MRVTQFIKKLNNTELGKTGMHETYVQIPQNVDISEMFETPGITIQCIDKITGSIVKIRFTVGRDKRIVGLGPYYKDNNVCAGDEIIFEKQEIEEGCEYYINLNQKDSNIVFQKMKQGFEILNIERLKKIQGQKLNLYYEGKDSILEIKFLRSDKKREDSPNTTDFYDLLIDDNSIINKYSSKELVELKFNGSEGTLTKFHAWKKYKFELEG